AQNAGVATRTICEAWTNLIEQLLDRSLVLQDRSGLTDAMQPGGRFILLGESDQFLNEAPHRLGLGQGGGAALMGDDGNREVHAQRLAVRAVPVEVFASDLVSHN